MADTSFKSHAYWTKAAKRVFDDRSATIAAYLNRAKCDVDIDRARLIYGMSVSELRYLIINDDISVSQLLALFYRRALTVGVELNALADVNIEANLKLAKELEFQLHATKKEDRDSKLGALFGVPISIKDNILVEGMNI